MIKPVSPDSGPGANDGLPKLPPNFYSGGAAVGANDPWYVYARKMFPNTMITPEVIAGLKKNMMTMINTTIGEINKREAENQKYLKKVAEGKE